MVETIRTRRLTLVPLRANHAAGLFETLADPSLYTFIPEDPPPDVATLAARFARWEAGHSPEGTELWLNWALQTRDSGSLVGFVQATINADDVADVAYVLARPAQGQGYGREAVAALVGALADQYQARLLRATVDPRNRPSIRLLEDLGFELVATRRDAEWIHGGLTDEAEYRLSPVPRPVAVRISTRRR